MAKQLTREQVQSRKDKAVRFLEDVKDDPDRAAEVEDESLEDYADRRGFDIIDNPEARSSKVADSNMSKDELLDYVDQLESENADLQDQLDSIADIVAGPAAGDDTDEDGDDTDDDGDGQDCRRPAGDGLKERERERLSLPRQCAPRRANDVAVFAEAGTRCPDRSHRWRRSTQRSGKLGLDVQIVQCQDGSRFQTRRNRPAQTAGANTAARRRNRRKKGDNRSSRPPGI